jgi:hypothetical protein
MSKRKKEIQKRKRLADDGPEDNGVEGSIPQKDLTDDASAPGQTRHEAQTSPSAGDKKKADSKLSPGPRKTSEKRKPDTGRRASAEDGTGKGRETFLLLLLVLYVLVLGLGTAGELFEIQWILDLSIFR